MDDARLAAFTAAAVQRIQDDDYFLFFHEDPVLQLPFHLHSSAFFCGSTAVLRLKQEQTERTERTEGWQRGDPEGRPPLTFP
jgi:hypothetical protein